MIWASKLITACRSYLAPLIKSIYFGLQIILENFFGAQVVALRPNANVCTFKHTKIAFHQNSGYNLDFSGLFRSPMYLMGK